MIKKEQFLILMRNVVDGWSGQNTNLALSSFAEDAVYMETPNIQLFRGRDQSQKYFDAVKPDAKMQWHNLWLDEERQVGAGEYTFYSEGSLRAVHGIVAVEIRAGKIAFWREFQQTSPADRSEFLNTENKEWKWHVGNYP